MAVQVTIQQAPPLVKTTENGLATMGVYPAVSGNTSDVKPSDKQEIERLQSQHPDYMAYKPLWDLYVAAYEGGPSFCTEHNLFKHTRETSQDFDDRVKRMHYMNYCEPLVDFFTTFIFAETIQRDDKNDLKWFSTFCTNVDRRGNDITAFMSEVSNVKDIYGMAYLLVDAPPLPEAPPGMLSKADVEQANADPYWVLVRPTEVLDWGVDQFDQFVYLKRAHPVVEVDPSSGQKKVLTRFTEWTRNQIRVTDVFEGKNGPQIEQVTIVDNQLGIVPFHVARYHRSLQHPHMGNSFLRDLAPNNREVMNLTSLLQEFLYRQCFNILAMEADSSLTLPKADAEDGTVGTSNVLEYPKGAKAPVYVVPSSEPANKFQDERRTIVAEMYRRAAQDTVNELFNGGGSSGFSKAQSFRTTVPRIANRAEVLEKAEVRLFQLTYQYRGKEWSGEIKYKDHYEITNLSDALNQLNMMFKDLLIPSATFAKEEMKRMVHLYDGKIDPDTLDQIYQEIEDTDWAEWLDTMKLSYLGRAATSNDVGLSLGEPVPPPASAGDQGQVKGKDTQTAPSTPQKSQASTQTVVAASSKTPKKK